MLSLHDLHTAHPTLVVGPYSWVWKDGKYRLTGPTCTTWADAVPLDEVETIAAAVPMCYWPSPEPFPIAAGGDRFVLVNDTLGLYGAPSGNKRYRPWARKTDVLRLAASAAWTRR